MKLWLCTAGLFGVLALVACQENKSFDTSGAPASPDGSANYWATTPQPCNFGQIPTQNCYNGTSMPPSTWPNGSWYWPTQYQPSWGQCGCPSGYSPVYTGGSMACAPHSYFVQSSVVYYNLGSPWGPAQNTQQNNIPLSYYQSQCQSQTAQGCDVRLRNCPGGSFCQAVSGGSSIGLCVRGP